MYHFTLLYFIYKPGIQGYCCRCSTGIRAGLLQSADYPQFLTKLDCEQSLSVPRNQSSGRGNTKINWRSRNWLYRKIPNNNPRGLFLVKGPFRQVFLFFWGGGGGLIFGGGLYMDEYLRFDNAIFYSSNCNLLTFSAHNLSLLLIFLYIFRSSVIRTVNINYRTHTV